MTAVEIVTAAVGTVTAGFIGWQAYETRRAAQQTGTSVQLTREALKISEESLRAARQLSAEQVRTRLDARASQLRVRLQPPTWPPHEPSTFNAYGAPNPLQSGTQYQRPRDDNRLILMLAEGDVVNEGARPAPVTLSGELRVAGVEGPLPPQVVRTLHPGEQLAFRLEIERSVSQWADNYQAREAGQPLVAVGIAEVHSDDGFDNGVIDGWRLELHALPLIPVPQTASAWQLAPQGTPGSPWDEYPQITSVRPQERRYYTSKSRNEQLEDSH